MTTDPRRAGARYQLFGADGAVVREGDAEATVGDDALSVGPVSVSYLDSDAVREAEYRVEIELWPDGKLVLTSMGRRHDTFVTELRRARNQGRVAGLLAHGVTMPELFEGSWTDGAGAAHATELQVYDTHVTLAPAGADPFHVPFGAVRSVSAAADPYGVLVDASNGPLQLGRLGRRRDACLDAMQTRLDAHARALREVTGQEGFADGLGVPRGRVRDFDDLVAKFTAPSRSSCVAALLAACSGDEPRLGFVQLLDPEGEALVPPTPLPEPWGAFLLVPLGDLTALEVVAGPAAATYVFRAPTDAVNRDLQALHFRRAPLALTDQQAALTLTNPHRLALRRLEPLRRLRACTTARLIHNEGWEEALQRVVG